LLLVVVLAVPLAKCPGTRDVPEEDEATMREEWDDVLASWDWRRG
jgi:hypothetical protein